MRKIVFIGTENPTWNYNKIKSLIEGLEGTTHLVGRTAGGNEAYLFTIMQEVYWVDKFNVAAEINYRNAESHLKVGFFGRLEDIEQLEKIVATQ